MDQFKQKKETRNLKRRTVTETKKSNEAKIITSQIKKKKPIWANLTKHAKHVR